MIVLQGAYTIPPLAMAFHFILVSALLLHFPLVFYHKTTICQHFYIIFRGVLTDGVYTRIPALQGGQNT